ncbi:protein-L-isoaspartate O-methyltransferase family protein [Rhodopila sp.]|uniref:protein-L-isoaspartate O-methyltransferase family protein n=1 Tax=Rhodopila sp. TaxID=2480087 RepID=UPI003D0D3282
MAKLDNNDIAAHSGGFIAMLDDAFRRYGAPDGLPARLRDAVAATPRHRFVHRFRVGDGALQDLDATPEQTLSAVYSDQVIRHVDADGELLLSSNSQPSYVLWLLNLLALEPGQAVLEIGSGSGWLAAIMARLVGPGGKVVGVELIPDLARQSRTDLAESGIGNVEIICGDGTRGHAADAPYHRAIITAATWDPPAVLFEQLIDGGRALVPIELRDGSGCEVTVLRRQGNVLVGERMIPGWFVPLQGVGQDRAGACRRLETLPLWNQVRGQPIMRRGLPLGASARRGPTPIATQFRGFLGRTEPGQVAAATEDEAKWTPWRPAQASLPTPPFGLVDDADRSLVVWDAGELLMYGGPAATLRLARAYASWAELGLPGPGAFALRVQPADAAPPAGGWVEQRGASALAWRLKPDAATWRDLLGGAGQPPGE